MSYLLKARKFFCSVDVVQKILTCLSLLCSNAAVFGKQLNRYKKDKTPAPSKRQIKRVGSSVQYVSDPKNVDPKSIKQNWKRNCVSDLFKSQYNSGCYAPYQPPEVEDLPSAHVVHTTQVQQCKPGHGKSFQIVGSMSLSP